MIRLLCRVALICLLATQAVGQDATAPSLAQIQTQAQAGDAAAQFALGQRYAQGDGVLASFSDAAKWFELAADQGVPDAQNALAKLYFEGLGVPADKARAAQLFEQAAASGITDFVVDLARLLETDPNTAPRAVSLYQQAVDAGNAEAMVSLGTLYQSGQGIAQDYTTARNLFVVAAEAGNARALNNLGLLYVRGNGVPQDYERAAGLFTAAAEAGVRQAFRNLGVLYENGFGVPLDEARAVELYRLAGQGAEVPAETTVRYVYDPRLRPLDPAVAVPDALRTSASAGDPVAQFQMAWLMAQSDANPRETAALFERSAAAGYAPAMINLGLMYFRGSGVLQDYVLGQQWLLLGAAAGGSIPPNLLAETDGLATAAQITEAQKRAAHWSKNP